MRKIILAVLLIISGQVFGQSGQIYSFNNSYGWLFKRLMTDSGFNLPKGDTSLYNSSSRGGALVYKSSDATVYYHNGVKWLPVTSATLDTTSNRINLRVKYSDTSSMLSNYIVDKGYGLLKSSKNLLVDTFTISTKANRDKLKDSLGVVISTAPFLKLDGSTTMTGNLLFSGTGQVRIGSSALLSSVGDDVIGIGENASQLNTGDNVIGIGNSAGQANAHSYVNLFNKNASATATAQTVFSKDGTIMARLGYGGLTASRLYTLPDASGTIALTSDLTSGYVPYTGATTSVNLGSQTLTTTGAVGTGALTSTTGTFSSNITISTVVGEAKIIFIKTGANTFSFQHDNARFYLYNNTTSEVPISVLNNSNVGIGVVSPAYKLDVNGTGNFTGALTGTSATFSGNVGIGTVSPSSKTEIQYQENTNRQTLTDILTISNLASTLPYIGHGAGLLFRGSNYTHNTSLVNYARIGTIINDNSVDTFGASLVFDVTPTSTGTPTLTRAMTIKYDGNVGIGTTGPTATLDVNGTGNFSGALTGTSAAFSGTVKLQGYTVATLPTGIVGMTAYVTDALAPTFGATLVGGGAVVTKAFFNGTNWVNE